MVWPSEVPRSSQVKCHALAKWSATLWPSEVHPICCLQTQAWPAKAGVKVRVCTGALSFCRCSTGAIRWAAPSTAWLWPQHLPSTWASRPPGGFSAMTPRSRSPTSALMVLLACLRRAVWSRSNACLFGTALRRLVLLHTCFEHHELVLRSIPCLKQSKRTSGYDGNRPKEALSTQHLLSGSSRSCLGPAPVAHRLACQHLRLLVLQRGSVPSRVCGGRATRGGPLGHRRGQVPPGGRLASALQRCQRLSGSSKLHLSCKMDLT